MSESSPRFRSPHYPAMDLEKAIHRTKELREIAKGFPVPLASAAKAWGFSEKSSATSTTAAALGQYGLIDDEGSKQNRRISVSELGEKIILDTRPDSNERLKAIQSAALNPTVFQELWGMFGIADVDEHTLVYELTLGRKNAGKAPFSASAAMDVSKVFRKTMEFAQPSKTQEVEENIFEEEREDGNSRGEQDKGFAGSEENSDQIETLKDTVKRPSVDYFEEKKALDEGDAILIWPKRLSEDSLEDIEYWLNGVLKQIRRRVEKENLGSDKL